MSRGIADWKLLNEEQSNDETEIYVSTSLKGLIEKGDSAEEDIIIGVAAGNEYLSRYERILNIPSDTMFDTCSAVIKAYWSLVDPMGSSAYTMWKIKNSKTPQEFYRATRSFDLPLGGPIRCYGNTVKLLNSNMLNWPSLFTSQSQKYTNKNNMIPLTYLPLDLNKLMMSPTYQKYWEKGAFYRNEVCKMWEEKNKIYLERWSLINNIPFYSLPQISHHPYFYLSPQTTYRSKESLSNINRNIFKKHNYTKVDF